MAEFEYRAVGRDEFQSGKIKAGSRSEVEAILADKGLRVVSIEEKKIGGVMALVSGFSSGLSERMSSKEKTLFTDQMAAMLKAGLPLIEGLEAFVDVDNKSGGSKVASRLLSQVQTGQSFSEALEEFPKVFPDSYVAVVRSGESSGTLAESLDYLGAQMQRQNDLIGKVRSAMIYPVVVMIAMVAVLVFISIVVIPKVVEFAQNSGQQLPAFTLFMVLAVEGLVKWWPLVLASLTGMVATMVVVLRSEDGARATSKVMIKLPLIGELVKSYNRARFARLLGGFYKHGVSVVGSFDILASSLDNRVYREASGRIKNKLVVGQTLAQALEAEGDLFPSIMSRLVKGAERTGELGPTLEKLAEYYEDELEVTLKNVTVLIEPILVIVLGIGVVGIALAVIVPVYKVSTGLR